MLCFYAFVFCFFSQVFARTEVDTHFLAFSEGALVPCSITAEMDLAQVTAELVKVKQK